MTYIIVAGDKEDKQTELLIKNRLSKSYAVTYVGNDSITRTGSGYDLIVMEAENPEIDIRNGILLMKEIGKVPDMLPSDITAIINGDNQTQIKAVQKLGVRTVTCGLCPTSTISFSSETEERLTVSLNRSITALSGKVIEPLEIPMEKENFNSYSLMSFEALRLLLDDFDSELGKLI